MFIDPSSHPPEMQTSLLDPEDVAEMVGIIDYNQAIIKAMGGPLAEQGDLSRFHQILDVACGSGDWVLDVAHTNPHIEIAGIDPSATMIQYANARASSQGLTNASFEQMDILHTLDFSDNTFDLVNAHIIGHSVPREAWLPLLQECLRILRPGGVLRTTDTDGGGHTNSAAYQQMDRYMAQAMFAAGFGFSPDGLSIGMTPVMGSLLKQVGCQNIQYRAHALPFSAGSEAHESAYQTAAVVCKVGQEFAVRMSVVGQEEISQLYHQMLVDMLADDFCGIKFFLTTWGSKPL